MKRVLSYAGIVLLAFLLQNNVFAVCPIIEATPNLLLILTFSIGFIRGTKEGMGVGFFCGLLMDFALGLIIGYYELIIDYRHNLKRINYIY